MTTTPTAVEGIDRITPGPDAWRLARAAYDALLELLHGLEPEEWDRTTVCDPWTVADMVGHVIGSAESQASPATAIRQQVWAQRHKGAYGGSDLDAWTALHVREHADLDPSERLQALEALAPRAVRGRSRLPRLLHRIPLPVSDEGSVPDGSPARITLGELYTVILTRDTWLHRIDITRATGRGPSLDPAVDGRIIEDVVVDWAGRHGRPFRLVLTGPAGGTYVQGSGGPRIELDAVDFAWILSGRGEPGASTPGGELLATRVLF